MAETIAKNNMWTSQSKPIVSHQRKNPAGKDLEREKLEAQVALLTQQLAVAQIQQREPVNMLSEEVNTIYGQNQNRNFNQNPGQSSYPQNQNRTNPGYAQNTYYTPSGSSNTQQFNQEQRNQARWNQSSNPRPAYVSQVKFDELSTKVDALTSSMKTIERLIGQMAEQQASRPQGRLPSHTEKNPRAEVNACRDLAPTWEYAEEELNEVATRSGKKVMPESSGNE